MFFGRGVFLEGWLSISSKTKGPGEKGAPWPISSADLPMTPVEGTEHHFGPF